MRVGEVGKAHTIVRNVSGDSLLVFAYEYVNAVYELPRYAGFNFRCEPTRSMDDYEHVSFWFSGFAVDGDSGAASSLTLNGLPQGFHGNDKSCELLLGLVIAYDGIMKIPNFHVVSTASAVFLYACLDAARARVPNIAVPSWFPELPSVQGVPASHDFRG